MKRMFLFIFPVFALFIVSTSTAQVTKGRFVVGGSIGYSTNESNRGDTTHTSKWKQNSLNIAPSVGYAFKNNLVAGVFVNYSKSNSEWNDVYNVNDIQNTYKTTDIRKNRGISPGVFVRLYKPLRDKLLIFAEAKCSYSFSKSEVTNTLQSVNQDQQNSNSTKLHGLSVYVIPGITYFLTNKFALELTAPGIGGGKLITNNKFSSINEQSKSFDFNLNPFNINLQQIMLGGKFYF